MSDNILQIQPVRRESAKLIICLAGQTGEGKTYSALLLALGLAGGDPSKVCLLDTENRRGSLYHDIFPKPFLIADFSPPFSPARYVKALTECAATGAEVIVVDSFSHEHEGTGGLEEIANNPAKRMTDWLTAKREHRKCMNAVLHLPCHIILCLRAREKMNFKDPKNPITLGIQPICEKNVMFEATFSLLLKNKGKERDEIKVPEFVRPLIGDTGYLTVENGKALREWLGGADPLERSKNVLRLAAGRGLNSLRDTFLALDKPQQKALAAFKDTLKDLAAKADEEESHRPDNGAPDEVSTQEAA